MELFRDDRSESLTLDRVREVINREHHAEPFDDGELLAAIDTMSDENQVMFADNTIFLI
jgi:hypothetical protein